MRLASPVVPHALLLLSVLVVFQPSCRSDVAEGSPDAGDDSSDAQNPYPPPKTEVVDTVGSAQTLEIATWNIENFPQQQATPKMVADLIASMDLDFVAVQEIANTDAFDELISRLRGYTGVLSSHTYSNGSFQKVGYIFKEDLISIAGGTLLFKNDRFEFPRPPLQIIVTVNDGNATPFDVVIITLHLKAGRGANDRARRRAAMLTLEGYIRNTASSIDSDVVVLGDFNEVVTSAAGIDVFAPFLDRPELYTLETQDFANAGGFTFVPSGVTLDHAITSASLVDERSGGAVIIPPLNEQYLPYNGSVSDHLPVVITMPIL